MLNKFEKLMISLRYWALGAASTDPSLLVVPAALEYGYAHHRGFRKDGCTPEFQHQLEVAHYLRTMVAGLANPGITLAAALLHDVAEDYDVAFEDIEKRFGSDVARAVRLLTKKHRGMLVSPEQYFEQIAADEVASVIKGADRIHNLQSMLGVFSLAKQAAYCEEVEKYFLPMLKTARRNFPHQEPVYENIKLVLRSQLQLLAAVRGTAVAAPAK